MNDTCSLDTELRSSATVEDPGPSRTPLETRTVSLLAAALIVLPFALYAGAAFFIPLLLSLFTSFALSPVVDWIERRGVPRVVGAAMTMLLVIAGVGAGVLQTLNGAAEVLDELPKAVQQLRVAVITWDRDGQGPLKQLRRTADELQKLAGVTASPGTNPARSPPPPAAPGSGPATLVLAGTAGMAVFIGQLVSVLFITYFVLAAGDLFRRRFLHALGPTVAPRRKALQILNQIQRVSQRYFALVLAMNIAVGFATWAGLALLDVRHPAFWGIAMAILHTIPYLGAAAVTAAVYLVAYLQSDSATYALAAAAVPMIAATLIGIWLQTTLMGRTARMNAAVVFVALLFFGMLWGAWGLLLAFPIMATIKIVFREIERLKPFAMLMDA